MDQYSTFCPSAELFVRKFYSSALEEFRCAENDANKAHELVKSFRLGLSLRYRLDEVETLGLAALEDVAVLIQAKIVVIVDDYIRGSISSEFAVNEITYLRKMWKCVRE